MDFKGSKTEKNLKEAFAGESMARNKYTMYASQAEKEGYIYISRIFHETAHNEKAHGKIWFKLLHEGKVPDTLTNLHDAASGEHYEWSKMYAGFATDAFEEGFEEIGKLFERICTVEKFHDQRYETIINNINSNEVFEKPESVIWECSNCGFHHLGKVAPQVCPLCSHPLGFFFVPSEALL